jgi:hypothetical protein
MNIADLMRDLEHHRSLCYEALRLFGTTAEVADPDEQAALARKTLPGRLDMSLNALRRWRQWLRNLPEEERRANPDVSALLQQTLDLMMKSIVTGKESIERNVPASNPGPALTSQPASAETSSPPHFVARRYARHAN